MKKGRFIVFEGLDLSGKTSIIKELKQLNDQAVYTREPGSSIKDVCNDIRGILFGRHVLNPLSEAYLFAASRAEQNEGIKEILNTGIDVICDRYVYSSYYYQGILGGIGLDIVKHINQYAVSSIEPDYIFYITVNETERKKRAAIRNEINQKDKESLNLNLSEADKSYIDIINKFKKPKCRLYIIDTSSKESYDVAKNIYEIINERKQ